MQTNNKLREAVEQAQHTACILSQELAISNPAVAHTLGVLAEGCRRALAAPARNCEDPDNASTLRAALLAIQEAHERRETPHDILVLRIIDDALAAPPRNCDVGMAKEQLKRYNKFCYDHRSYERCCGGCPLNGEPCCELAWAQMPY